MVFLETYLFLVGCSSGMNLVIHDRDAGKWTGWIDLPEEEIKGLVDHRLYDSDDTRRDIVVYSWVDDFEPPDAVREALLQNAIDIRPK